MSKNVIIPESDLDKLEEARIKLSRIIENIVIDKSYNYFQITGELRDVSQQMWQLTHKKYNKIVIFE